MVDARKVRAASMTKALARSSAFEKTTWKKRGSHARAKNVVLHHGDGSIFVWKSAFLEFWRGWPIISTEHHGTYVYLVEDTLLCMATER